MLEKFRDALLLNDDILFFNEDFNKVTFCANQMVILATDLHKISFDDDSNFDGNDSDTIILRLLAWCNKFENPKALKKKISKELMPLVCHPKR